MKQTVLVTQLKLLGEFIVSIGGGEPMNISARSEICWNQVH